ncbi:MAG: retention module-containing protein, partial [Gammaproteobacteria bacterium]|nr:retention module-containing protein [Gammaproteobacteria bacterium]
MATKSIGYVAELIGDAQVRSIDGVIRVLSIGDQINEGDVLTTGISTQIVLEFYDGQKLQLGENTEILLDESVFASLNAYPDDRADQLAELQSLIVEGIDLAELEATAAGASGGSSNALHQASVYSREGSEGIVETRVTPFNNGGLNLDDQRNLGDDSVVFPGDASTTSSEPVVTPAVTNNTPVAVDDTITAIENTLYTSTIDLDANDLDVDGDALTVVPGSFTTTQGGTINIASNGSYTYTPAAGFNGNDSVSYTVSDGSLSDVGTLNINVSAVNNVPDAMDDVGALDGAEDSTTGILNAVILANDSDLDGDTISITAINGTALVGGVQSIVVTNGTVNIDAFDNISFTPSANYNGPVSFDYTLSDGSLSDTATVSGVISPVNDQPEAADVAIAAVEDGPTVTGSFVETDADVTDTHTFAITSAPAEGSVINNNDGSFTFDPGTDFQDLAAGETRDVTFTYTATDDSGAGNDTSAPQTVTVTVT